MGVFLERSSPGPRFRDTSIGQRDGSQARAWVVFLVSLGGLARRSSSTELTFSKASSMSDVKWVELKAGEAECSVWSVLFNVNSRSSPPGVVASQPCCYRGGFSFASCKLQVIVDIELRLFQSTMSVLRRLWTAKTDSENRTSPVAKVASTRPLSNSTPPGVFDS